MVNFIIFLICLITGMVSESGVGEKQGDGGRLKRVRMEIQIYLKTKPNKKMNLQTEYSWKT